jgi:plasmid maintenance system antidote protein VapI
MNPQFWLNLQSQYDLRLAEVEAGKEVRKLPTRVA